MDNLTSKQALIEKFQAAAEGRLDTLLFKSDFAEVVSLLRAADEPSGALDKGGIMQLVQQFASSWSLVGGRFDDGTMLEEANKRRAEIRAALDGIKVVTAEPPTASLIDHIRANKELADNNMELRGLLREARPYIESFSRLTKLETAEIDALKLRDQIVAALRGPETKPASCAAFTPYPGDPDLCAHCNKARSSHETTASKCYHEVIINDRCVYCKAHVPA